MLNTTVEERTESQRRVIVLQAKADAFQMQVDCSALFIADIWGN